MILVFHARQGLVESPLHTRLLVENAVRRAGLPPLFELERLTEVACQEAEAQAIDGPFSTRLKYLLDLGKHIRRELGVVLTLMDYVKALPRIGLPPDPLLDLNCMAWNLFRLSRSKIGARSAWT